MSIYCQEYLDLIRSISKPNRYTNFYISICERASLRGINRKEVREKIGYVEKHHIVPKSFELVDKEIKANQVFLTAKEHFICHHLLVKMVRGDRIGKMWFALHAMCVFRGETHQRIKISARQYEYIKSNIFDGTFSDKMSSIMTGRFSGLSYFNDGTVTVRREKCPDGFESGRIPTDQARNWFTNGVDDKIARECPDGYWPGRVCKHTHGTRWFTNGIENICGFECPIGWVPGQTKKISRKGLSSWTNGIENIYSVNCPRKDFWRGQANKPKHEKFWVNNGKVNKLRTVVLSGWSKGKLDTGISERKSVKTLESLIIRSEEVYGTNKFDFSGILFPNKGAYYSKIEFTCLEHNQKFVQTVKGHVAGKIGCTVCQKSKTKK